MRGSFYDRLGSQLADIRRQGKYKEYRILTSPMGNIVSVEGHGDAIIMCSNNYNGLANNPDIKAKAISAIEKYGLGASSVRFICGTYDLHRELESVTAGFLGMPAALTYTSCWAANTGVIPALLQSGDAVISDELNHASIIDGCKATVKGVTRAVFKHSDMKSLEQKLVETKDANAVLIVVDGVFSMEGDITPLPDIVELAGKYNALVMVDDSHATGVIGRTGRGTCEYYGIKHGVDIITGTYGKSLGGAGGGFVAARKEITETLVQLSRPSLFSNALPPVLCSIAIESVKHLTGHPEIVTRLREKTAYIKKLLADGGITLVEGDSAIVPVMIYDTPKAIAASEKMLQKGLYAIAFGYPVVPEGQARIRLQVSDCLSYEDIEKAARIILETMRELG